MLGRLVLDTMALAPERERITIIRQLQRSIRVDVNRSSWVYDIDVPSLRHDVLVLRYEYTLGEYVVAMIYSRMWG